MAAPENPSRTETISRFTRALNEIKQANVEGISEMAERVSTRKDNGEIGIDIKDRMTSLTGFSIVLGKRDGKAVYLPQIVLNQNQILSASSEEIQADLVRTINIADAFPDRGYEERLVPIYEDALEIQTEWLNIPGKNAVIDLDPRTKDHNSIIRSLLGDPRFYSDVGMGDMNESMTGLFSTQFSLVRDFLFNIEDFIGAREEYAARCYAQNVERFGVEFIGFEPERRALLTAEMVQNYIRTALNQRN